MKKREVIMAKIELMRSDVRDKIVTFIGDKIGDVVDKKFEPQSIEVLDIVNYLWEYSGEEKDIPNKMRFISLVLEGMKEDRLIDFHCIRSRNIASVLCNLGSSLDFVYLDFRGEAIYTLIKQGM